MAHVTVRQALLDAGEAGVPSSDDLTQVPVHELIALSLYEIANNPDASVRGSFTRANKARDMIFKRTAGTRRPGSAIAGAEEVSLEFTDLTKGALG